ncbi:MAG: type II toxin-antitoxin system VapC family toxin [Thermoanaerobaculia bacterium]
MKFWDSSALLALVVAEPRTAAVRAAFDDDSDQTVWCLTEIEIASALARRGREDLEPMEAEHARGEVRFLSERWRTVHSIDQVRPRAIRLVNTHPIRAGDAVQLAAALVTCLERPDMLPFVCLDDRLRDAARREGFPVLPA